MAIEKISAVPVDLTGAKIWAVAQRPAVKREQQNGNFVEIPKTREGVQGVEIDALVQFPDSQKAAAKFTVYRPMPQFGDFEELRVVGKMVAGVWSLRDRPGGGLWFDVEGLESATKPAGVKQ